MGEKQNSNQTILNLKDSCFFSSKYPGQLFSFIICLIHHIQLLSLCWINANIILRLESLTGNEITNLAVTYFTFIEDEKNSELVTQNSWKLILSILVVLFFSAYFLVLLLSFVKRTKMPKSMLLSFKWLEPQ